MKILVLKDPTIPENSLETWQRDFNTFITPLLGLSPEVSVESYDFTGYPVEPDVDGTQRPGDTWLKEIGAMVTRKHGPYAFDHIILWIHTDNWKSNKIWGTNYSYVYGRFHVHYCRFDKKNAANSFGTIHHEMHHSYDALVKVETGVDVHPLVGVAKWDAEITHGGKAPWKYMRWKENSESIKLIAPHMRNAYTARRKRHTEHINGMQRTVIGLAKQVLYLLRSRMNAKDGIQL